MIVSPAARCRSRRTLHPVGQQGFAGVAGAALLAALVASPAAGIIDPAVVTPQDIVGPGSSGVARIAIYDDLGARNRSEACHPAWIRESMRHLEDLDVSLVSAEDIRRGGLDGQFDVLVVGGGLSKTEAEALGDEGKAAITRHVEGGGGSDLPAESESRQRTAKAAPGKAAGPRLIPLERTPAVVASRFGAGRVVIFSPHPERAPGPQTLFWTAVRFAAGRTLGQRAADGRADVGVALVDTAPDE